MAEPSRLKRKILAAALLACLVLVMLQNCLSFTTSSSENWQRCENQREGFYLQPQDVSYWDGPGLLHNYQDFLEFAKLAYRLDRILVDYTPTLSSHHAKMMNSRDIKGHDYPYDWLPWSFYFNLNDMWVSDNVIVGFFYKCRLKVVPSIPENFISVMTVDYGVYGTANYRGKNAPTGRYSISKPLLFDIQVSRPPPSAWIRSLSWDISRKYFNNSKYFAIHLRGRDRPCLLLKDSHFMTTRLISNGLRPWEKIYLMTDMKSDHPVVKSVHQYFHNPVITAKDIAIFKQYPFTKNNHLVFNVELGLVYLSTSFINTYPHFNLGPPSKELSPLFHLQRSRFLTQQDCQHWI